LRVEGSGFRVQGSGLMIEGSGFRVEVAGDVDKQNGVCHEKVARDKSGSVPLQSCSPFSRQRFVYIWSVFSDPRGRVVLLESQDQILIMTVIHLPIHSTTVKEALKHNDRLRAGRGTARAEDAQGTPTQSHMLPSMLVYEEETSKAEARREPLKHEFLVCSFTWW